jgi:hypothetical protein
VRGSPTTCALAIGTTSSAFAGIRGSRSFGGYHALRGCGERGLPTTETIERLGLAALVDDAIPLDDGPLDPDAATSKE